MRKGILDGKKIIPTINHLQSYQGQHKGYVCIGMELPQILPATFPPTPTPHTQQKNRQIS